MNPKTFNKNINVPLAVPVISLGTVVKTYPPPINEPIEFNTLKIASNKAK